MNESVRGGTEGASNVGSSRSNREGAGVRDGGEPIVVPLLYVSRSGSTMLARYLSRHLSDVVVLPETRWAELLLVQGDAASRRMGPSDLSRLMRRDPRIVESLGGEDRAEAFAHAHAGKGVADLIVASGRWVAEQQGKTLRCLVIKHGELFRYLPSLRRCFRDVRLLHVVRDPRGAAASPFRNRHVKHRRLTPGVIWRQARRWAELSARTCRLRRRGWDVVRVHYEQLVLDPRREIERFASWVGADFHAEARPEWEYRVPGRDRAIHALLYRAPDVARSEGWKRELPPHLGVIVERATWGEMPPMGYEPWFVPRHGLVFQGRVLGGAWADLMAERVQHAGATARRVLSHPEEGLLRVRTALRRVQDRWEV